MLKAKKRALRLTAGSVLAIPIEEGRWVLGQIIQPGVSFYLAIGGKIHAGDLVAEAVQAEDFRLFSWTNDAEVYSGAWKYLGEQPLPEPMIELPEYKLGGPNPDQMRVCSFSDRILRSFDAARDSHLRYKSVRSPKLVERIAKASHGIGPWEPGFEAMTQP